VGEVLLATVSAKAISLTVCEQLVGGPDRGAVVGFGGIVRDHDHGRIVVLLEYSAHPSAQQIIGQVAQKAADRPGVCAVALVHRTGVLHVGDTALACAVSAPHRAEAFGTAAWLVDEIKRTLPVWKRQQFADGSHEWVNCP
jgi:molybdopterin synthase catalytic subunit